MGPTERRIEIPGLELAVKLWGPKQGVKVLALHGWLDNAASFDALSPRLDGDCRIAAVDLPGHGASDWRHPADAYHFADWVDVVLRAADALGWEQFSLLGHSMGGAVASLTAPVAPSRVERMVFLDALGPMSASAEEAVERLERALSEEHSLRERSRRSYESIEDMIEALSTSRGGVDADGMRPVANRSARRAEDGTVRFGYDPRLKAASRLRLTEPQVLAFLEQIACPVLLIRPRGGWPADESAMSRRLEAIGDIDVVEVPGSHYVHLENPDRLSEPVLTFLSGAA